MQSGHQAHGVVAQVWQNAYHYMHLLAPLVREGAEAETIKIPEGVGTSGVSCRRRTNAAAELQGTKSCMS